MADHSEVRRTFYQYRIDILSISISITDLKNYKYIQEIRKFQYFTYIIDLMMLK